VNGQSGRSASLNAASEPRHDYEHAQTRNRRVLVLNAMIKITKQGTVNILNAIIQLVSKYNVTQCSKFL